jgi:hypothetical protein
MVVRDVPTAPGWSLLDSGNPGKAPPKGKSIVYVLKNVKNQAQQCMHAIRALRRLKQEDPTCFCNPSYLGGRDQEDHSSRPGQVNSLQDPISKILYK